MKRRGVFLIVIGLSFAAATAARFVWLLYLNPDTNDPLAGFLTMVGFWAGLLTAGIGCATVAQSWGILAPPV